MSGNPSHGVRVWFCVAGLTLAASGAFAQARQPSQEPAVEVASVRWLCAHPGRGGGCDPRWIAPPQYDPSRFTCQFCRLWDMISLAFHLQQAQVIPGEGWLAADEYRVTVTSTAPASRAQMMALFRTVLVRAFGLRYHMETKPSPVYRLIVGKHGLKAAPGAAGEESRADFMAGIRTFDSVPALVDYLNQMYYQHAPGLDHPVEDGTGLTGPHTIRLSLGAGNFPGSVPLLALVREQVGLEAERVPGQIQHLVIDHADHLTGSWP